MIDETTLAFPFGRSEAKRRRIHAIRARRRWRRRVPIIAITGAWEPTRALVLERAARIERSHKIKEPAVVTLIPDRLD